MKAKNLDDYIEHAQGFAQPILKHLRALVHSSCPDVDEQLKWGFPHFVYKGQNLCSMASFKQHCAFGFWLGPLMSDPYNILQPNDESTAMGQFGRISGREDLPADAIIKQYILEAAALIDAGKKLTKKPAAERKEISVPPEFKKLLNEHPRALDYFNTLAYSHRKEYLEWIGEAKRDETRIKRMLQAIEMLSEGKHRHWKYQ